MEQQVGAIVEFHRGGSGNELVIWDGGFMMIVSDDTIKVKNIYSLE